MRKELIFQNSMKISSCLFVTAFSALVSPAFIIGKTKSTAFQNEKYKK